MFARQLPPAMRKYSELPGWKPATTTFCMAVFCCGRRLTVSGPGQMRWALRRSGSPPGYGGHVVDLDAEQVRAARRPDIRFTGVEIDDATAELAAFNVRRNGLAREQAKSLNRTSRKLRYRHFPPIS